MKIKKKIFSEFLFSGLSILFLYYCFFYDNNLILSRIAGIVFYFIVARQWIYILKNIFGLKSPVFLSVFSLLSVLILQSFFGSAFLIFYKLDTFFVWLSFLCVSVFSFLLNFYFYAFLKIKIKGVKFDSKKYIFFKKRRLFLSVYAVLIVASAVLLFKSGSTAVLQSPWFAINNFYLPVFFFATLVLGVIVFSKFKIKTVLFLLVVHSFVLHFYLPLSHSLPWGGDVWRHYAMEQKIYDGEQILPVIFGENAGWKEVAGVDLPEVFLMPQKYNYGEFWAFPNIFAKTFGIDLLQFHKWFIPVFWSFFVPSILFFLGRFIFQSERLSLFFVWLGFLPFSLQANGSLSSPTSLGFVVFAFILMLWLRYLFYLKFVPNQKISAMRNLILFFGFLMILGYSLYFILFWLIVLSGFLFKYLAMSKKIKFAPYVYLGLAGLSVPIVEIVAKMNSLNLKNIFSGLKSFLGEFSGWYYASAVRPHDILSGNILFNHTPDYAFYSSVFTDFRWHILVFSIIFCGVVSIGIYSEFLKRKLNPQNFSLFAFASIVFGGYFFGWYFMTGDRLLTRRLDSVLAIALLVFFVFGATVLFEKFLEKKDKMKIKIAMSVLIFSFSWFITTSYASGPDLRVLSETEYQTARDLLSLIESDPISANDKPCVIADTWFLLGLEGVSKGKIIGGGFPIDYQFGQAERVKVYNSFLKKSSGDLLLNAREYTGSSKCWGVFGKNDVYVGAMNRIFRLNPVYLGDIMIWKEGDNF